MKALVYYEKHALENFSITLAEISEPELRPGDLLIRVAATGMNPGDTLFRQYTDPWPAGYKILGFEWAGIVERTGKETSGFSIGDRVYGTGDPSRQGSCADLLAVDYRIVSKIPESVYFTTAAAAALTGLTAWQAIFRAEDQLPKDVRTILIIGAAGGVGSMAIQLLKVLTGAKVIATASRPESAVWCWQMGADEVIDHNGDVPAQMNALGIQADLVFVVNGLRGSIKWIDKVIRPYGYLSVIEVNQAVNFDSLISKSVNVWLDMVFTRITHNYAPEIQGKFLQQLGALLAGGEIKSTATLILDGLTVNNIRKAHGLLEQGKSVGKIVLSHHPY